MESSTDAGARDVIRVDEDPAALPAEALEYAARRPGRPTPFMRLEYLLALHTSGSATADRLGAALCLTLARG